LSPWAWSSGVIPELFSRGRGAAREATAALGESLAFALSPFPRGFVAHFGEVYFDPSVGFTLLPESFFDLSAKPIHEIYTSMLPISPILPG
jgi:hypothetical protein